MTNIKFEVKSAETEVKLDGKTKVDLIRLQEELLAKKNELLAKKTIEEATQFLQALPIFCNDINKLIVLGDKYMQFESNDPNYQQALQNFKAEIDKANAEIAQSELFKKIEEKVVVQETKKEEVSLNEKVQKDIVDNTFLNAPVAEQLEKNNAFQKFLSGKNDFEASLKEYHNEQVGAFKTMLLAAMQSAREKYASVNGKQGEVKFTLNEWYTLQFVDVHKDQLKGSISDSIRNMLLTEYRAGLNQNGTPRDLQGYENPNNSINPASVEQKPTDGKEVAKEEKKEGNKPETTPEVEKPTAVENLTPAQRDAEIKKTIAELIQNGGIKVEKVDGKAAPYAINLTQKQWQGFRRLYDLNYINTAVQEAQDGSLKISRIDRKINKLVDKAQKFAVEGKFDQATKATEEAKKLAQEKVRDSAEYAKLATDLANLTERYQRNVGLGSAGLAVAKQSKEFGYHGNTFAIDAYHPAFVNICKTLCVSEPQFGSIIDLGNGQQAVIDCPELRKYTNNQIDRGLYNFTPDAYNNCPSEYRQGWLEKMFLQTNMTPEQAKKNANLLTAGGIGVGLFFLGRWLFTGKGIDGKEHKAGGFFGRLGITAGSLLGINMLSQGFTGNNAMDIIKGLWYGDVKFEDLWNGKMGKERILGGRFDVANIALRDIPMVALAGCSVETQGGGIKVNLSQLEAYLNTQLEDTKLSAERRGILEQQLEAIRSLKNDPQGEQKLQALFAEMGITYAYISDPKNSSLTLNDNFDTKSKNGQKLQEYLDKQGSKLAVPDSDPEVTAYLLFGKPTIDELAAKGKFTKLTEFEKAKDTQVVEPALLKVDQKYAPALQLALNKMSAIDFSKNNGARPGFSYENGILSLDSYGVKTPIWLDAENKYRVVGLDIAFPSAEEAVKTANLLNFIVVTYNGSATVEEPFNFIFGDIKKTDGLKTRRECFDKSKVASTIKNIFGTEVIDGDDYTLFPWTKSTIKDIGGSELAGNAGRTKLVQYLNGLKKKTDQTSIWKKGVDEQAGIVHTNEIEGWFGVAGREFPKAEVDNSSATNTSSSAALETAGTGVATGAAVNERESQSQKEKVDRIENTPTKVEENDKIDGYTEEETDRAERRFERFGGLDGGNSAGKEKEERGKLFFKVWSRAFGQNQKFFTVDVIDNKGIKKGLIYERQPGFAAPKRVKEGSPWGYENTVEKKAEKAEAKKVETPTEPPTQIEVKDQLITISQLGENMSKIWDKYFVQNNSFPYKRQKDCFAPNINNDWVIVNNQYGRYIQNKSILLANKSLYTFQITNQITESNNQIGLKKLVKFLNEDINKKLEQDHDKKLLSEKLANRYIGREQLFSNSENEEIQNKMNVLKGMSTKQQGLLMKNVSIIGSGEDKKVQLSFKMDGGILTRTKDRQIPYNQVFNPEGKFLTKSFYGAITKKIKEGPFNELDVFTKHNKIEL